MPSSIKPMLGDIELSSIKHIDMKEGKALVEHKVPGLHGDLITCLNRNVSCIILHGLIINKKEKDDLEKLREKFRAAEPLPFIADITTGSDVHEVLIENLRIKELAGRPGFFEYSMTLREFISPPEAKITDVQLIDEQTREEASIINSQQVEDIAEDEGYLEVQVDIEGEGDYTGVVVVVEGEIFEGKQFLARSKEHVNGLFRFTNIKAGSYIVKVEIE
jgi:hypothetical protein